MITSLSKFSMLLLLIGFLQPAVVTEQFVTITPCHPHLANLHNIPVNADCSNIRWNLTLMENGGARTFQITSDWGFYVDNSTLEKRGKAVSRGTWVLNKKENIEIVTLRTDNDLSVSFRKLDENHLHVLDEKGNLMNGNGGWSFTLNKIGALAVEKGIKPTKLYTPVKESFSKKTFHGRTPCQEISKTANINNDPECFKLKWLITLYQDSTRKTPTRYELRRTFHRQSVIECNWRIYFHNVNGRTEIVYELDPEKPKESIRLMKGDDDVLFFLDKNFNFLRGNEEFSYTMNARESE